MQVRVSPVSRDTLTPFTTPCLYNLTKLRKIASKFFNGSKLFQQGLFILSNIKPLCPVALTSQNNISEIFLHQRTGKYSPNGRMIKGLQGLAKKKTFLGKVFNGQEQQALCCLYLAGCRLPQDRGACRQMPHPQPRAHFAVGIWRALMNVASVSRRTSS